MEDKDKLWFDLKIKEQEGKIAFLNKKVIELEKQIESR